MAKEPTKRDRSAAAKQAWKTMREKGTTPKRKKSSKKK